MKNQVCDPNKLSRVSINQCLKQDALAFVPDYEAIGQDS